MTARSASRRGWPLLSLALLLTSWVALRAALWEMPFDPQSLARAGTQILAADAAPPASMAARSSERPAQIAAAIPANPPAPFWLQGPPASALAAPLQPALRQPAASATLQRRGLLRADRIIGHALAWQAGYGMALRGDTAPGIGPGIGPVAPGVTYAPEAARRFASETTTPRWSIDFWALWREDNVTPFTSGRPSYGRSQVGAVLAYRLAPASGHAPQLHLRTSRALAGRRETEIAAGLSGRPIPAVPLRLAAEARVSETDRGTELRGAAYAVSEVPPVRLPAGFDGEAYVQAGYVSGEYATPFVDGQARVVRTVVRGDGFRLTAGAGAWGGAQEDSGRLDIGPSAALGFDLGRARGRLAADYRFRVAGNAEPASGPAITLTAGF